MIRLISNFLFLNLFGNLVSKLFNRVVDLPEFNSQQVKDLASRHNLRWSESEVERLMAIVGGHPYLVRVALYHISKQDLTLEDLPVNIMSETGIYSDHLRRHSDNYIIEPIWYLCDRQPLKHQSDKT